MVKYKVQYEGQPATLTLDNGKLDGDPAVVRYVLEELPYGQVAIPGLPVITGLGILTNTTYFEMYCKTLFGDCDITEGEQDPLPGYPDGATP